MFQPYAPVTGVVVRFTLLSFALLTATEGVFVWMLLRRTGAAKKSEAGDAGLSKKHTTNELDAARARALPEPVPSVTEHTTRTLEHAAQLQAVARVSAGSAEADLFIYPGFTFRVVGALLTNFHLPQSTLLMLVSAFAGRELVLKAYRHAVEQKYRFFSYGDCMFIE